MIASHTQALIDFLNSLLKVDRHAIAELFATDVVCNDEMAHHPTVQVRAGTGTVTYQPVGQNRLTILGLLNGFCGVYEDSPENQAKSIVGWGPIMAVYSDGQLVEFVESKTWTNKWTPSDDHRDATDDPLAEPPQTQTLRVSTAMIGPTLRLRSYADAECKAPADTTDWLLFDMARQRPNRPYVSVLPVPNGTIPTITIDDRPLFPSEIYLKASLTAAELLQPNAMQLALERCLAEEQRLFDEFAKASQVAPWVLSVRGGWQCVERSGLEGGWGLFRLVGLMDAEGRYIDGSVDGVYTTRKAL